LKVVSDVYKPGQGAPAGIVVAGKIETGFVSTQDKVILSPNNHICTVKTLHKNHGIQFSI
jgi:selenocysteine-specific translation elongation factor